MFRVVVPRYSALDRRLTRLRFPPIDDQWFRIRMYESVDARIAELNVSTLDAAEISGGASSKYGWRTFTRLDYPSFDVCSPGRHETYDAVFCDNVLEHVADPFAAARTLFALCRPGGLCFVGTPFMFRVHPGGDVFGDYWRFTREGIERLLACAGFSEIETQSWGNRWCVGIHLFHDWLGTWRGMPMRNEAVFPMQVWAFGRRQS
jgi:SAM-dependent methyltransferase